MKLAKIVALFMLVVVCYSTSAWGAEDKYYVDPQSVVFKDNTILVAIGQDWVVTNAVYTDADGFYIQEAKWPWTPFICKECRKANPPYNLVCEVCGTPRAD